MTIENPNHSDRTERLARFRMGTEVLDGLRDLAGKPVGETLVNRIVNDPELTEVVLWGPPGIGKTTLRRQLQWRIIRIAKGTVGLEEVEYETILENAKRRWGEDVESDPDLKVRFNELLLEATSPPFRVASPHYQKRFKFVETVGVGSDVYKDRGVSALREMVRRAREYAERHAGAVNTLFIYEMPDPLNQLRAAQAREYVLSESDFSKIEGVLDLNHHIWVTGLRQNSFYNQISSDAIRGLLLQHIVGHMAQRSHIEKINGEMIEELGEVSEDMRDRLNTLYYAYKVQDLQLPEEMGIAVMNPHAPNRVIHWYVTNNDVIALGEIATEARALGAFIQFTLNAGRPLPALEEMYRRYPHLPQTLFQQIRHSFSM